MDTSAVYGVVLAAGRSTRFGSDKLLTIYRGRPLVAPVLDLVAQATRSGTLAGGLVVSVPGHAALEAEVTRAGLGSVTNDEPEAGVSHSLRLAFATLAADYPQADGALVFVGDQPQVRSTVVEQIVSAWRQGAGPFVRPRYLADPAAPGHPVLIAREVWDLAGGLTGDRGFGPLLNQYPELVTVLDVPGTNPDIDTPDDLNRLVEHS
jgi:CTP:molybdopterin cytidylyltransferase MocA